MIKPSDSRIKPSDSRINNLLCFFLPIALILTDLPSKFTSKILELFIIQTSTKMTDFSQAKMCMGYMPSKGL